MHKLKELRSKKNITQQVVADLLSVTRAAYTNIENGKREPDFKSLKKLADYFEVSTDYLLDLTDVPNVQKKEAATIEQLHSEKHKKLYNELINLDSKDLEKALDYIKYLKTKQDK